MRLSARNSKIVKVNRIPITSKFTQLPPVTCLFKILELAGGMKGVDEGVRVRPLKFMFRAEGSALVVSVFEDSATIAGIPEGICIVP